METGCRVKVVEVVFAGMARSDEIKVEEGHARDFG
jgi:hypothetical protein